MLNLSLGLDFDTKVASTAVAAYTPNSETGMILFLDPTDTTTLFSDAAGNTLATAEVRNIKNKVTGAAADTSLIWDGSTNKPQTGVKSTNGKNGLYFGTDCLMHSPTFDAGGFSPFQDILIGEVAVVLAVQSNNAARTARWLAGTDRSDSNRRYKLETTPVSFIAQSHNLQSTNQVIVENTNPHVIGMRIRSDGSGNWLIRGFRDGVWNAEGASTPDYPVKDFGIGGGAGVGQLTGTNSVDGTYYSVLIQTDPTLASINRLATFAATKVGLTWTPLT